MMTSTQLRGAIAMAQVTLRQLAEATGTHASQISRAQRGETVGTDFMRKMELYFTGRGLQFSQQNGDVSVTCPDPLSTDE